MQVFCRVNGRSITFDVTSTDTIWSLKKKIAKKMNMNWVVFKYKARLTRGTILENMRTIEFYNIHNYSSIDVSWNCVAAFFIRIDEGEYIDDCFARHWGLNDWQTLKDFKHEMAGKYLNAILRKDYAYFSNTFDLFVSRHNSPPEALPNDTKLFQFSWFPQNVWMMTIDIKTKDGKTWYKEHIMKLLVFGYVRRFIENKHEMSVPIALKHLCKLYFKDKPYDQ